MCHEWWALHAGIKRDFFKICIYSFSTKVYSFYSRISSLTSCELFDRTVCVSARLRYL